MRTRVISIIAIVTALTLIGGCGGGGSKQSSEKEPASSSTTSIDRPVSKGYRIVMWDANLHAEADGQSSVVGRAKQGERLEILKRKDLTFKNITVPWFYVKTGTGKTGWICDADLQE